MRRGDIVVANFPYQDVAGNKVRPALVVQNDADNATTGNTILAVMTGNLADAGRQTNIVIDPVTVDGAGSGLSGKSLLKCGNLAAVRNSRVCG